MNEFSPNPTASRAVLKDRAKDALEGHYSTAALLFFLMMVVTGVANTAAELLAPVTSIAWEYALLMVAEVFTGVLKTGSCLFCLNLCCGRRARVNDLFYGYHYQAGKSLQLSLVNVLLSQLYLLPANLTANAWASGADTGTVTLYAGVTLGGTALYMYLSLYVAMSWYLLLDFPGRGAGELLRLSARVIRGHKGRLFVLYLSFLPLQLLNLCTFGIGSLWISPYIRMTYTEFFLDIMSKD